MKGCSTVILVIIAVIGGLAVGLLLGWVVWPVQWTDASPENLRSEFQVDWMNMAIDSYSVNQNADLAAERYSYLGEDAEKTLAAVLANPEWVSEESAQAYAEAVTGSSSEVSAAEGEATAAEESVTTKLLKPPLFGYVVVALFLALIAVVLLVILVIRLLSGEKKQAQVPEEAPVAAIVVEEATEEVAPVAETETIPEAETVSEEEAERSGGLAAAAVAGAAVAAMVGGDEQEVVEAPVDDTSGVVEAVAVVGADEAPFEGVADTVQDAVEEEGAGSGVGLVGAAAAAAGLEWALEEEPKSEDVAAGAVSADEWQPEPQEEELPADFYGKYNRKVIDIEGIGDAYAARLADAGITTTHALLQQCATPKGREELALKTNISGKLILEWANHADMMRIQGVGPQWSDLLEMVGVNTVREMALRNPENLYNALIEINEQKKLVRQLPTQDQVEDWIEQAKDLPRILSY